MKHSKYITKQLFTAMVIALLAFASCVPDSEDEGLPAPAEASFEIEAIAARPNNYLLKSTTAGGFIYYWSTTGTFKKGSETETVYFKKKGTYLIKLRVASEGGTSELSKSLTVENDG